MGRWLCKGWIESVCLAIMAVVLSAGGVHAAGFALMEQGVKSLGNAFSGGAAAAEDASTIFFNPAGLTLLEGQQANAALHVIKTSFEFDNKGSTHALTPLTGEGLTGDNGGNAGTWNLVPNFYYAANLGNRFALGFGVNVPFGLTTEYDDGWVGRYHTLKSAIMTINLNPSIAYQVTDRLSLGLGVSAMYMDAELSQAIDFGTILAAAGGTPQRNDGKVELTADDWGFGFNAGALYQFREGTRVGASYRSRVKQKLEGDADFKVPANVQAILAGVGSGAFRDGSAAAEVTLPDMASLSIYHRYSPRLAVMADVSWTNWSTVDELRIKFKNPEQPESVATLEWKDAWRFGVGATYTPIPSLDLRTGVMYDQTPIPDAERRTPRLPDEDRLWVAVGTSYRYTEALSFDLGYTHLFIMGDAKVNMDPVGEDLTRGGLKGEFDNSGDIVSAQVNYAW